MLCGDAEAAWYAWSQAGTVSAQTCLHVSLGGDVVSKQKLESDYVALDPSRRAAVFEMRISARTVVVFGDEARALHAGWQADSIDVSQSEREGALRGIT